MDKQLGFRHSNTNTNVIAKMYINKYIYIYIHRSTQDIWGGYTDSGRLPTDPGSRCADRARHLRGHVLLPGREGEGEQGMGILGLGQNTLI